jgi:protein-tyrosine phosphatase
LQRAVGESIRLHRGCDFHLSYENIRDAIANPTKYTIRGRRYLLVEFSDFLIPNTAADIFSALMNAGMTPVVTHPERNPLLRKRLQDLADWIRSGCRLQVTGGSLLGHFGPAAKQCADHLVSCGIAHFVASDAHDTRRRTTDLRASHKYVSNRYGKDRAEVLFETNPAAALEGTAIPLTTGGRSRRWFLFR